MIGVFITGYFYALFWVLIGGKSHENNLGILAHVDGKETTLTESLLYTSGAIAELGA